MDDELDRVDRQIDIDATADRVWALVARPGWYVNQGSVLDNPRTVTEGDVTVLEHPEYGPFRFRTVALEPPRYAAFRWLGEGEQSTLVEFWVSDRTDGGVTLRVCESGFTSLAEDPAAWLRLREENEQGWATELAAARDLLDPRVVQRAVQVAVPPAEVWPLVSTAEGLGRWRGGHGRVTDTEEPTTVTYESGATLTVQPAGSGSVATVRQTGLDEDEAGTADEHWRAALGRLVTAAEQARAGAG